LLSSKVKATPLSLKLDKGLPTNYGTGPYNIDIVPIPETWEKVRRASQGESIE